MVRFDFVGASVKGYRFLAAESDIFLRLAFIPVCLKISSLIIISLMGLEANVLRQGILMMPAYAAEGWLIAQLIRMAIFNERWPFSLSGDQKRDQALFITRSRSILACVIIYSLVKLSMSLFAGLVFLDPAGMAATQPQEPDFLLFIFGSIVLGGAFWAFRLLWLYVPAALDYPLDDFLKRIRGYGTSFYLLGLWLLCFVPLAMVLLFVSKILGVVLGEGAPVMVMTYLSYGIQAIIEMLMSVVASIAFAFGVQAIYEGKNLDKIQ
jgi:hypothetical protein